MFMGKEIWKDIEGYEGLYQVSNLGRVKSLNYNKTGRQRIKKAESNKRYFSVTLWKDKKPRTFNVHRLVCENFNEIPKHLENIEVKELQVNHKDGNTHNNKAENLEWCTARENNNEKLHRENLSKSLRNNPKKSTPIKGIKLNGSQVIFYPSFKEATRNGFDQRAIKRVCDGICKQHKGYKWEYVETA